MGYKWYIIRVKPGNEEKVAKSITEGAEKRGISDKFQEIYIPFEECETFSKREKRQVIKKRKLCPNYIFLNMILDDVSLDFIKSMQQQRVIFLNDGSENAAPQVITEKEMEEMLNKISQNAENEVRSPTFGVGDSVKIIEGVFNSMQGKIAQVNEEKKIAKVFVTIFGCTTQVELELAHLEKIVEG